MSRSDFVFWVSKDFALIFSNPSEDLKFQADLNCPRIMAKNKWIGVSHAAWRNFKFEMEITVNGRSHLNLYSEPKILVRDFTVENLFCKGERVSVLQLIQAIGKSQMCPCYQWANLTTAENIIISCSVDACPYICTLIKSANGELEVPLNAGLNWKLVHEHPPCWLNKLQNKRSLSGYKYPGNSRPKNSSHLQRISTKTCISFQRDKIFFKNESANFVVGRDAEMRNLFRFQ